MKLIPGDLLRPESLTEAVRRTRPDELYHLASPSFQPESWLHPARTINAIAGSTATLLEAVRDHSRDTHIFVAASGAMFGAASESPQREDTPCRPMTPYAIAKLAAHELAGQLRQHDGIFACSGILYNHESERREESFVTRKITRAAAAIKLGLTSEVKLGDVEAVRDWSYAADIVRGAWLMLQQDVARDYVLASGKPHTVREFAQLAFGRLGLNFDEYIQIDADLVRASESTPQVGDAALAREILGWRPTLSFEQLVYRMVDADLRRLESLGDAAD